MADVSFPVDEWAEAREAYNIYGAFVDFKNYQDLPMPPFDELSDKIKGAWRAVGKGMRSARGSYPVDARELAQILHAIDYAYNHKDAGIPGHSQFLLIAKLWGFLSGN